MEITNRGVSNAPLTPRSPIESGAGANASVSASSISGSTYTPSAELQRLLAQVKKEPEVRADHVQAASKRLQQGYYHTPSSIAQTAEAIINRRD
jgi:hypothetical protein